MTGVRDGGAADDVKGEGGKVGEVPGAKLEGEGSGEKSGSDRGGPATPGRGRRGSDGKTGQGVAATVTTRASRRVREPPRLVEELGRDAERRRREAELREEEELHRKDGLLRPEREDEQHETGSTGSADSVGAQLAAKMSKLSLK